MMTNEKTAILIEMTCHNDDKLPRNPAGKILKRQLREKYNNLGL